MGEIADELIDNLFGNEDWRYEEDRRRKDPVCRHCGADNVYWAERAGVWTLYDFTTSRRHVCRKADLKARSQEIVDAFDSC